MVDFGGWDMPVQYPAGTIEEHLRTRTHAGLFDVSHMGEIDVRGSDAIAFVNRITSNDVTKLIDRQAQYSALTTPQGTVVDDLVICRFAADHLLLVVNAGTTDKDWQWITSNHASESVKLKNVSADYCQLALQGPDAQTILQKLTDSPLAEIKYYHFTRGRVDGSDAIVSRTGTPVKTVSKFTQHPIAPNNSGTRFSTPATLVHQQAYFPAALPHATLCDSKPAWRSTATTSTKRPRYSKQISDGFVNLIRATSTVARPSRNKNSKG